MLALSWLYVGYVGLMLAYAGFILAHVGIMLAHAGFMLGQVGSCWLKLAPSWPQDVKNGPQEPPRASKMSQDGLKNASGRLQDEVKIEIFEVSLRKTRKCIWSYYSNVFLLFGSSENIKF